MPGTGAAGDHRSRRWSTHREERRVVRAVGFVPVESKLHEPSGRDGVIPRGELVDRLRESTAAPAVLVTAPAGYGKTTLLRQWAAEDPRPFAWLSLDSADNDPVILITYLLLALQQIEPIDPGTLVSLTGGNVAVDTVMLPRLGRMLSRRESAIVLVLDDAHVLTEPTALAVLSTIIAHLPEGSQIGIAGREPPDLPWHHLRAAGRLTEIATADLALTTSESRDVLAASGVVVNDREAATLHELTEGWAAGLYLTTRSRRDAAPDQDVVAALTNDDSGVVSYLYGELLADLSDEDQLFLLRTSLLDRMCGVLCDTMLGSTGSGDVLRRLNHSNMFIVPLDREDRWYRFHHLFRNMLRAEHARREPLLASQFHARASRWFETAGDIRSATHHAHAAGDIDRAAALVWVETATVLSADTTAHIERQVQRFSNEQVVRHTHLALAAAWVALVRGHPVEHWLSAAERGAYDGSAAGGAEAVAAAVAVIRATLASHGVARMTVDAKLALHLQDADDPWRTVAMLLQGVGLHLSGHRDDAVGLIEECMQLSSALGLHVPHALALTQLALLDLDESNWQCCEARIAVALSVLDKHDLTNVPMTGLVHCMATLVLAKQGRTDEAARESRRALAMIAITAPVAPWLGVEGRYLLARGHLTMGDTAAARSLLSEAQTSLTATADAVVLRDLLEDAWQHVERSPLSHGGGSSTLTTAELRVLQFLPTHLSFEQISQRLFVSRNTVKTQAIAAYRKLGVSSRSEAVERASSLGLVQP